MKKPVVIVFSLVLIALVISGFSVAVLAAPQGEDTAKNKKAEFHTSKSVDSKGYLILSALNPK